jgi:hypothetical protein
MLVCRQIFEYDSDISNIGNTDILLVRMRIRLIRCQHCAIGSIRARTNFTSAAASCFRRYGLDS